MIFKVEGVTPKIDETAFVASTAVVTGDVALGENASIWYNCVVRGDTNSIKIGKNTNIQDNSVLHVSDYQNLEVGDDVAVGHCAILHACKIGNNVLIAMGATVLDGAEVGDNCIIGAGALVPAGKKIEAGSVVMGSPGKVVREFRDSDTAMIKEINDRYIELKNSYMTTCVEVTK